MPCQSECMLTASLSNDGRRIMISMPGNEKFPEYHTVHPQCWSCVEEQEKTMRLEIEKAFPNDALFQKFADLKKKVGK